MAQEALHDGHGRRITDLRVSVTDRCNFRCQYCMPAEGMPWLEREEILTFEEVERLVALMSALGIEDIRLTGGEPLARREFPRLASMLAGIPGIRDLSLTTNGYLLERDAARLAGAGIQRVNVSIDSLQRDRFFQITRRDALPQVLRGLRAIPTSPPFAGSRSTPSVYAGSPRRRSCPSASSRARAASRSASSSSCLWTPTTPGAATRC
jgi:GTP 3',8-cyclase